MRPFLATLIGALMTLSGLAATAQTTCDNVHSYRVYFGNGIGGVAPFDEYADGLNLLHSALGESYGGEPIVYDYAYNATDGVLRDLLQSSGQIGLQSLAFYVENPSQATDDLKQTLYKARIRLMQVNDADLNDQVVHYMDALRNGEKVFVVAHSQGNFYVNEAKTLLQGKAPAPPLKSFGILALATPASNVGGALSPYLTNDQDPIQFVAGARQPNWHLADNTGFVPALGFIEAHVMATYMRAEYNVRSEVINRAQQGMSALVDPIPDCPPPVTPPVPPSLPGGSMSSADINYLPALFSGVSIHKDLCGPKQQNGDFRFGGDGSVTGSECFEGLTYPALSTYYYTSNDAIASGLARGLSIYVGSSGSSTHFIMTESVGARPVAGVSYSGPKNGTLAAGVISDIPLGLTRLDAVSRMNLGLRAIANRSSCNAFVPGVVQPIVNSHIEYAGSTLRVMQGDTLIAMGSLSGLESDAVRYEETYTNVSSTPKKALTMSLSKGTSSTVAYSLVGVTVSWQSKDLPDEYSFSAVGMTLPNGSVVNLNCSPPP